MPARPTIGTKRTDFCRRLKPSLRGALATKQSSFFATRAMTGSGSLDSLRRELHFGRGGAHVGIDLGFELGEILLEHADQSARRLVELGLVLPGIDGIENVARHARQSGRHRETEIFIGAEFYIAQ